MDMTLRNLRASRIDGTPLPPPPVDAVRRCVDAILDETSLCAWASVTPDAHAHVNIGYFAHSGALELYLLSHPGSVHCRNISANPSMAVAVFPSGQEWTHPGRGMQLFGSCSQLARENTAHGDRIYGERFRAYEEWKSRLTPGDPASDYRMYRFAADRLKLLDEAALGDGVFVEADILR